jgi:hypothetical protein
MAQLTLGNTNYNGDVLEELYRVLSTGFSTRDKGLMRLETGIDSKRALPTITGADDPIGAYDAGAPSTETATVTYAERDLTVSQMMVYLEFIPRDWHTIWPMFRSVGDFTNLALNPEILRATLDILGDRVGKQMDKLVWQGDTASGTPALTRFDGLLKYATNDATVIDVPNIGVITKANVVDVIEDVWEAIPNKFFDDPEFKIIMNTGDFKLLQQFNNDAKKTTVGVLDEVIDRLFLEKRIEHVEGLPASTVYATKATTGTMSNTFLGVWVDPLVENNAARIMRVSTTYTSNKKITKYTNVVAAFNFTKADVADSLAVAKMQGSMDNSVWVDLTDNTASLSNTTTDGTTTLYVTNPIYLYYRGFLSCATGDTVAVTNARFIIKED